MNTVLKTQYYRAKRKYHCSGAEQLIESGIMNDPKGFGVSYEDMRTLVNIRKEDYMILPGTKYVYQVGTNDNAFYAIKVRADAFNIIIKYNLYDDF